jgi:hypothetical protein
VATRRRPNDGYRPADDEPVRFREHLRVAVRRPQQQVKQITLADRLPAQPQVLDAEEIGDLLRAVSVVDALDGETTAVFQDCGSLWFPCSSIMRTTN